MAETLNREQVKQVVGQHVTKAQQVHTEAMDKLKAEHAEEMTKLMKKMEAQMEDTINEFCENDSALVQVNDDKADVGAWIGEFMTNVPDAALVAVLKHSCCESPFSVTYKTLKQKILSTPCNHDVKISDKIEGVKALKWLMDAKKKEEEKKAEEVAARKAKKEKEANEKGKAKSTPSKKKSRDNDSDDDGPSNKKKSKSADDSDDDATTLADRAIMLKRSTDQ